MNRFEIRDILNAHKEHFRALPTLAANELNGIIDSVNQDESKKEPKRVVGKRIKKAAKKSSRPKG